MRLSSSGKRLVEHALTAKVWTLEKLAGESDIGISTVKKFSAGKDVRRTTFVTLCQKLEIHWETVAEQEAESEKTIKSVNNSGDRPSTLSPSNKNLFAQVREHCRQKILNQHSRMRLLSGEEIGVGQLYVDVWLLNRLPSTFQVSESKLLETFDLRNDRLGLGDRIKRNTGFEIANANPKLLILGKPGSGKTTFLKHLAVDWCKGLFQPDLIAVFIEFRRVRDEEWHLLDAIGKELGLDEGLQIRALKQQIEYLKQSFSKSSEEKQQNGDQIKAFEKQLEDLALQILLKEGKLLVLIDGLDEVPTNGLRRSVQSQLRQLTEEYKDNRWILTCRTQIIEAIPIGFTSVEMADFDPEQVQQFVQNWFRASGQADTEAAQQWEKFNHIVSKNSAVKELTVTPVLLSLMCLVFHDEGEMPSLMTDLYKKGIRLLLEKWNDAKAIEAWEVGSDTYRQLSVEQKEALLIEIAARKFESPKNFVLFQQDEIADQIAQFLHLTNRKEGVAALKAMEAQHGLLIERADELWSFSHLTFQEYFTVQWLTQLSSAQLADKIANPQWQEVVEKLVRSQQPADRLLRLIKQSIDRSLSGEPTANQFLTWALQKANSIRTNDKPAALRAFYFVLAHARARTRPLACNIDIARDLALALARNHALARDLALARTLDLARALDLSITLALDIDIDIDIVRALALAPALDIALDLDLARALDLARDLARVLDVALAHTLGHSPPFDRTRNLAVKLEQLRTQLPLPENQQYFQQWWQAQGLPWLQDLQQAMIQHRNIGHNWQFNQQQKQQLQRYYDANHFLVKLMQIEGAVSQKVQAEIEDSLLLPWDELQRRYPEVYGSDSSESKPT